MTKRQKIWRTATDGVSVFGARHLTPQVKEWIKLAEYRLRLTAILVSKRRVRPAKTVLFYPHLPYWDTKMNRACLRLGWDITSDLNDPHDLAFFWQDATFKQPDEALLKLGRVLNVGCRDVSKKKVDRVFTETFGYSSFVDPKTAAGPCVRKSDMNARHDGRILERVPGTLEDDYVYQRLFNNEVRKGWYQEMRVCVFNGKIVYLSIKERPENRRFNAGRQHVTYIGPWDKGLSAEETERTLDFCGRMGMDYAELDLIRDKDDSRLYVIDANDTPYGGGGNRYGESDIEGLDIPGAIDYAVVAVADALEKELKSYEKHAE